MYIYMAFLQHEDHLKVSNFLEILHFYRNWNSRYGW